MKYLLNPFKHLAATTLIALALVTVALVGCASNQKNTENMAVAAGFKIITPTKPDQVALLPTLPKGKVTRITYEGKIFFVLPDVKNNVAYVGTEAEYQKLQQLRLAQQMSNQNLEAAQMNSMNSMNWNSWGGWGRW